MLCAVAFAFACPAARADEVVPENCEVSSSLVYSEEALPFVAGRLERDKVLTILVIGSGSTAGSGVSEPRFAYPEQLRSKLLSVFPSAVVTVRKDAKRGATAKDMLRTLESDLNTVKPSLVIWQTGTADALRSVPLNEFGMSLDRGLRLLKRKMVDVILMDMQFSPMTDAFIHSSPYRGYMRWAAKRNEVILFRRYDIMEYWWNHEVFDLGSTDAEVQLSNADNIHECIAGLLAQMIARGVRQPQ